ncbi:MAG: hypothetical protein K0R64_2926 [Novosphingobium lindaniclasticum]|jgi:hypothetical protein|uniref:hypothetical protein n=1 Tax=Novosphingobium lindaniclasticum TaxID=1329895 RepID=UPI002409CFFF|nr:hypothetical protein [Novosphingobium lindaniclasticum]MDF2639942.1 hypothetical protein [Novosphingobium lindaniclasticum]
MPVTGWKLDRNERAQLLERFPPIWPDVIADHVTLKAGASANDPLPVQAAAEIVGSVDDGEGLQALIVSIDGSTDRPDGSTYHITWSLDRSRDRKAVQSNDVIAERGWEPLPAPVPIHIEPARFS